MNTVRIGILGAAGIVGRAVTTPAGLLAGVEATAVAARTLDRAAAFAALYSIPRAYGSYEELLSDPAIKAIYNPTPNGLHGRWTLASLAAGKHVLCEKPFTANADEARTVADAADSSGLVVMEAFHYRYHPLILRLLEILHSGEIGTITRVDLTFVGPRPPDGNIRWDLSLAGGALMDMGSYAIHLARTLFGTEPVVMNATAVTTIEQIDDSFELDLVFGATPVHVTTSMVAEALKGVVEITGELGRIEVINPFTPQRGNQLTITTKNGTRTETTTTDPSYTYQLEAFVAAVLDGADVITDARDAVRNMAVIDSAYVKAGLDVRQPTR